MYHKKYLTRRKPRKINKPILLFVLLGLIVTVIIGGTIAYLITNTSGIENTFIPSHVSSEVVETLSGLTKSNVMIKNIGDTEAYIRAAIVVTWQDENGNVSAVKPVASDYTMSLNLIDSGWSLGSDGFYYYASPVVPEGSTGVLITSCTPVEENAPSDFHLSVEIIGSAIQSTPTSAVEGSWGVTINGTAISKD